VRTTRQLHLDLPGSDPTPLTMAAAVAELTGLPISQAIDLFEQHGSVVAAVSAHFDRMPAHGTTTTDSSGPQSSHHGAGAGAPAADARRQSPSGPAPSVDGILGKARDVAAPITGPMGGVGRSLAEPPTVPTGNRHERKIDVVFFRDGVGFLELPADGSQAARKTGMHTFEKRPTLPAELESLEGHRVLLALPSSDPRYKKPTARGIRGSHWCSATLGRTLSRASPCWMLLGRLRRPGQRMVERVGRSEERTIRTTQRSPPWSRRMLLHEWAVAPSRLPEQP
jgi:hypothetical protein